MNKIATTPRGFPFDELALAELQEQTVPAINAIARLIPDKSIVYGCVVNASTFARSDGFIIWNNELMPFIGGAFSASFSIIEQVINRPFNVGTDLDPQMEDHPAYFKRYAQIGVIPGAESVHLFSDLNRAPNFLTYLQKGRVFIGTVVPTYGRSSEDGGASGTIITVSFESVHTANYMVLGNFFRQGAGTNGSFNYEIYDKKTTSFKLLIKDVAEDITLLSFDYLILPSNIQLIELP